MVNIKTSVYMIAVDGGWLKREYVFDSAISLGTFRYILEEVLAGNNDVLSALTLDKWPEEFKKKYPEFDFESPIAIFDHEHYEVFELNGIIIKISRYTVVDSRLITAARSRKEKIT